MRGLVRLSAVKLVCMIPRGWSLTGCGGRLVAHNEGVDWPLKHKPGAHSWKNFVSTSLE
jgi:hypothetical protein